MSFGLRPIRNMDGTAWNGNTVRCAILSTDATDYFVGDPVVITSAGSATIGLTTGTGSAGTSSLDGATLPIVGIATAASTNRIFGVIVAFEANRDNLSRQYGAASTARTVLVALASPGTVFEAREDAVGGAMALTNVGNGVSLVSGSGSTTTGYSGWLLDSSTAAASALQCLIVGLSNKIGNATGSSSTVWEVIIAQPQMFPTQVGAAV
ncbi:MAG: hypothetical protein FJW26_10890 [Acidimicrobiia bacterium]|nr:hypothetical protein [Acidimicrobiia bacterium]